MSIIEAIIYGLVQGFTEFIPVSSSGHLTLLGRLFDTDPDAMFTLSAWLHMGTLIAVFIVMRREIVTIIRDIFGPKTWQIVLATIPAVIVAFALGGWLSELFGGRFLGYSFLLTGVILLAAILRRQPQDRPEREIGYREALIAGIGQAVAILPGVSRSGTTLTALLATGVERKKAIRFSFLMSIPAIMGGFVFDLKDLLGGEGAALTELGIGNLIIGVIAAAAAGWLAMEWMLRKLNRKGFRYCAIYVLILGTLVLFDQSFTRVFF